MPIKPAFIEQSTIRGTRLQLQVKTSDLGDNNQGGAHLFDAKGHFLDVSLKFSRKSGNDDVFAGSISTKALKAKGFDLATLQATAFVDVPGSGKQWEGNNHVIVKPKDDALTDLGNGYQRQAIARTVELFSGTLTLDGVNQQGPMTGSHTTSRQVAVTGATFEDKKNFFKGAAKVKLEIHPEHNQTTMTDYLYEESRPNVENRNAMSVVTLVRQADGRYKAEAPANKAFFSALSEQGMSADALTGIKVSVFDPKSGKEDSLFGADYTASP